MPAPVVWAAAGAAAARTTSNAVVSRRRLGQVVAEGLTPLFLRCTPGLGPGPLEKYSICRGGESTEGVAGHNRQGLDCNASEGFFGILVTEECPTHRVEQSQFGSRRRSKFTISDRKSHPQIRNDRLPAFKRHYPPPPPCPPRPR